MKIDDAQKIIIDDLAKRYKTLSDKIKKLETQKDELKTQLMAHDGQSGEKFKISVTEYTSDRIESLKAIRDKSQALFDMLHEAGCVKEVTATRLNLKEIK